MTSLIRPVAAALALIAAGGLSPAVLAQPANPAAAAAAATANPPPSGAQQMTPDRPPALPPPEVVAEKDKTEKATDLVRDRPRTLNRLWSSAMVAMGWASDMAMDAVEMVSPPSTRDIASEHDSARLFKLLGFAGYKLKEIDNEVGLIPGLAFKFGLVRELSEADLDYLDEQMDHYRFTHPGVLADVQRGIVSTVVAINSGGGMQVSELKLRLLPLPKAEFSITPSEAALSEEGSALMRAIQRVDRRVRDLSRSEARGPAAEARR